jgi:hypothetical protein
MSVQDETDLRKSTDLGHQASPGPATGGERPGKDDDRTRARKRIDDRRSLFTHLFVYLVTNAFLLVTWAATGAGTFWPLWSLAGWGIAIVLHVWDYYWRWMRPVTDEDVDTELNRMRHR